MAKFPLKKRCKMQCRVRVQAKLNPLRAAAACVVAAAVAVASIPLAKQLPQLAQTESERERVCTAKGRHSISRSRSRSRHSIVRQLLLFFCCCAVSFQHFVFSLLGSTSFEGHSPRSMYVNYTCLASYTQQCGGKESEQRTHSRTLDSLNFLLKSAITWRC